MNLIPTQMSRAGAKTEVLKLISQSKTALSRGDIGLLLHDRYNRVTIYRALMRLIGENLIQKIINPEGRGKYVSCQCHMGDEMHNHVHFCCIECGSVVSLENVEPVFDIPAKYHVKEINFTLSGICPDCCS